MGYNPNQWSMVKIKLFRVLLSWLSVGSALRRWRPLRRRMKRERKPKKKARKKRRDRTLRFHLRAIKSERAVFGCSGGCVRWNGDCCIPRPINLWQWRPRRKVKKEKPAVARDTGVVGTAEYYSSIAIYIFRAGRERVGENSSVSLLLPTCPFLHLCRGVCL